MSNFAATGSDRPRAVIQDAELIALKRPLEWVELEDSN